jgi:hypothetical protein
MPQHSQPQPDDNRATYWRLTTVEKRVDNVELGLKEVKEDAIKEAVINHKDTCPIRYEVDNLQKSIAKFNEVVDKLIAENSSVWPKNVQGWLALIATAIVIFGGSWGLYTFAYNASYGDDAGIKSIMLKLDALEKGKGE